MRRALLVLLVLSAAVGGSTYAFAASLGVSAKSLTSYAAAGAVPTTPCTAYPAQDVYSEHTTIPLFGWDFGWSNHDESTLRVGSRTGFVQYTDVALVQFDLSCLPANAKIVSADLRLHLSTPPSGSRSHGAHLIAGSWTPTGSLPGISGSATSTATTGGSGSWTQWNVTSDVQSFVSGTATNYGWAIEDDSSGTADARYDASETSSDPELKVEFWP